MRISEFADFLSTQRGIVRLVPMSEGTISRLRAFEFSAPANGFLPVEPCGFDEVVDSSASFVLFFDRSLSLQLEPFMDLVDSSGNLVGHDILSSERHLYDSPDYMWLSDTMFFDITKIEGKEMRCKIRSVRFRPDFLPEGIEARVHFPCTSSVQYLIDSFGEGIEDPSVVILGVDGVEKD
jgi:hypothetical protein